MRRTNLLHLYGNKLVECVDDFFFWKNYLKETEFNFLNGRIKTKKGFILLGSFHTVDGEI